ncbi:MAG: hypothetical protein H6650_01985 [Ardenticatenales bacterium]|nr:hypothetical protein [Ardenticatenales bacterium]
MSSVSFIPSYIEVLSGLLIFGITLPSILITIPAKIRAIREKHTRKIVIGGQEIGLADVLKPQWVVALVVFSIMLFVGYLVPSPKISCDGLILNLGCLVRDFFIAHVDAIAGSILGLNVVITALFIGVLISFTKDYLLFDLAKQCRHQVRKNNGCIEKTVLESIGELGEFCDAGRDKESVLDTLSSLADLNLAMDSWVHLARTVRETVVAGNERNYIHAMNTLQDMFRKASETRMSINGHGTESVAEEEQNNNKEMHLVGVLQELENVMVQAFTMRNPRVTATILTGYDELALQAPIAYAHAFFRIGKAGLELNETRQVVAALDKFHTKVTEFPDLSDPEFAEVCEAVHVFFGLLAHFWCHGNATRQHALTYIEALATQPQWDSRRVDNHMQEAKIFFQHSDFIETAGYLEQMLYENNLRQFAKDFLINIPGLDALQCQRILTHYPSPESLRQATLEGIIACGIPEELARNILSHN